jgi:hypothetical protein
VLYGRSLALRPRSTRPPHRRCRTGATEPQPGPARPEPEAAAVYSELMSDEPLTAADAQDEQRLPLPRHLAALVGALHGPADLGANHDAYLTHAPGQDRAEGAASA